MFSAGLTLVGCAKAALLLEGPTTCDTRISSPRLSFRKLAPISVSLLGLDSCVSLLDSLGSSRLGLPVSPIR